MWGEGGGEDGDRCLARNIARARKSVSTIYSKRENLEKFRSPANPTSLPPF